MSTLMQPLDNFINEQIKTGAVPSELEAEEMIISALSQRVLNRKLARAQAQVKNGEIYQANDDFINELLLEGKQRIKAGS